MGPAFNYQAPVNVTHELFHAFIISSAMATAASNPDFLAPCMTDQCRNAHASPAKKMPAVRMRCSSGKYGSDITCFTEIGVSTPGEE